MSRKSNRLPSKVLDPELQEARLSRKVRECRKIKFFGTVTLHIQAGNLVRFETRHVEKLEPEEEPDGIPSEAPQADGQQTQEEVSLTQQASEAE